MLVNCTACNGKGWLQITLGLAGQDPREIGATNIVWGDPYPPTECAACKGTGKRKQHKRPLRKHIEETIYKGIEIT